MSTEIIEGNKLIAEFMEHGIYPCSANYHAQWSLLMPVVEKISKFNNKDPWITGEFQASMDAAYKYIPACTHFYGTLYIRDYNTAIDSPHIKGEGSTMIEATWLAVTQFIKWYQNQILNNTINHGC